MMSCHSLPCHHRPVLAQISFSTGNAVVSTSSTWNSANPNTHANPAGRNTNAIVKPTTVMTSKPGGRVQRHLAS